MKQPPPDYEIDASLIGEFGPESVMSKRKREVDIDLIVLRDRRAYGGPAVVVVLGAAVMLAALVAWIVPTPEPMPPDPAAGCYQEGC